MRRMLASKWFKVVRSVLVGSAVLVLSLAQAAGHEWPDRVWLFVMASILVWAIPMSGWSLIGVVKARPKRALPVVSSLGLILAALLLARFASHRYPVATHWFGYGWLFVVVLGVLHLLWSSPEQRAEWLAEQRGTRRGEIFSRLVRNSIFVGFAGLGLAWIWATWQGSMVLEGGLAVPVEPFTVPFEHAGRVTYLSSEAIDRLDWLDRAPAAVGMAVGVLSLPCQMILSGEFRQTLARGWKLIHGSAVTE